MGLAHGDDFALCGLGEHLGRIVVEFAKVSVLNVVCKTGEDVAARYVRGAECPHRVIRWLPGVFCDRGRPRHAELLAAMLGPRATPLSAPGVREPGQGRASVREGGWPRASVGWRQGPGS